MVSRMWHDAWQPSPPLPAPPTLQHDRAKSMSIHWKPAGRGVKRRTSIRWLAGDWTPAKSVNTLCVMVCGRCVCHEGGDKVNPITVRRRGLWPEGFLMNSRWGRPPQSWMGHGEDGRSGPHKAGWYTGRTGGVAPTILPGVVREKNRHYCSGRSRSVGRPEVTCFGFNTTLRTIPLESWAAQWRCG